METKTATRRVKRSERASEVSLIPPLTLAGWNNSHDEMTRLRCCIFCFSSFL